MYETNSLTFHIYFIDFNFCIYENVRHSGKWDFLIDLESSAKLYGTIKTIQKINENANHSLLHLL